MQPNPAAIGFNTNNYNMTAGQINPVNFDCNVLIIESGTGSISIKTTQGEFIAFIGRVYRFDHTIKILSITDSVSESIAVTFGFGLILFNPSWAGSGGAPAFVTVVNDPIGVHGPQDFNHAGPITDYNKPLVGSMLYENPAGTFTELPIRAGQLSGLGQAVEGIKQFFGAAQPLAAFGNPIPGAILKDTGGGTFASFPLQTYDSRALMVGGLSTNDTFTVGPGYIADTSALAIIGIGIGLTGAAPLIVTSFGTPIPVFREDGSVLSNMGIIPAGFPAGIQLYVNTLAHAQIEINSADPLWVFAISRSTLGTIPGSDPALRRFYRQYANVTAAFAAGNTLVIPVPALATQQISVYGYDASFAAAIATWDLRDTAGALLSVQAQNSVGGSNGDTTPLFVVPAGLGVNLNVSAAVAGSIQLRYEVI